MIVVDANILVYSLIEGDYSPLVHKLREKDAEWRKLDATVSEQFKKKLAERLQHPRVPSVRLAGQKDRYKIKLRSVGYRLVYEVRGAVLLVIVVAVGKRERNAVYNVAAKR